MQAELLISGENQKNSSFVGSNVQGQGGSNKQKGTLPSYKNQKKLYVSPYSQKKTLSNFNKDQS